MKSVIFVILVVLLFQVSSARNLESRNSTQSETAVGNIRTDVNTLEEALTVLNELTVAQKKVWEQQESYKEEMQNRSRALEAEQLLLKEIRNKISGKLKVLSKDNKGKNGSGQSNCNCLSITDVPPKDCATIYLDGEDVSGVYKVWPTWNQNGKGFLVYCDMDTDGGGWTVIHRWENVDISQDYFERSKTDYINGFGDLATSFWIGIKKMHELTSQGSYELRFDFQGAEDRKTWSVYRSFRVDEEDQKYAIHVESLDISGSGGDVFSTSSHQTSVYQLERCQYSSSKRKVWWFNSACETDSKLYTGKRTFSASLNVNWIEMKVRPVQFSRMKEI